MANRRFKQFRQALEAVVTELFLEVTFGATGAPTLVTSITLPDGQTVNPSKGIASVVRTGTGAYTITLQDNYVRMLMLNHRFIDASAPASPGLYVVADNSSAISSPNIQVVLNAAGTATDPASGEQMLVQIVLSNSTAP